MFRPTALCLPLITACATTGGPEPASSSDGSPTTATLAKEREQTGHGIFDAAPVPQSYQQQQQQVYKLSK